MQAGADDPPDEDAAAHAVPDDDALAFAARLFDLARAGDRGRLAAYVDAGVPVDLTDSTGNTLLMLAAYHGQSETVRALLHRGADTGRLNDRGQTPLAGAVFKRSSETVRALLDGGADPRLGTPSAIETARFFQIPGMVELLSGAAGS